MEKNPQNVENVMVGPNPSLTPSQVVEAQLQAVSRNDTPWCNHGIQTAYEFAEDSGSMELAPYFRGSRVDLYHFDHFMGKFSTRLAPLMYCTSWKVLGERLDQPYPGDVEVDVEVVDRSGSAAGVFTFTLVKRQLGSKQGSWMTKVVGKRQ